MNTREIFQALLDGKKVGFSKNNYMRVSKQGMAEVHASFDESDYYDSLPEHIGCLITAPHARIIEEE